MSRIAAWRRVTVSIGLFAVTMRAVFYLELWTPIQRGSFVLPCLPVPRLPLSRGLLVFRAG
jgi:hypothetical protein